METSEIRKLFAKCKKKMMFEAVLKSLLLGIAVGFVAVFILSLVFHILTVKLPLLLAVIVFLCLMLASGELFFALLFYPNDRRVAARIDETGLNERAGTMLQYRSSDKEVAVLQRADAVGRIRTVKTKNIGSRVKFTDFLVPAACMLLAVVMMILPYNLFSVRSSGEPDEEAIRQQRIIDDLIERLRQEVKEAENDKELEERLNKIIDELEKELKKNADPIEKAAKISKAQEQIDRELKDARSNDELGEALEKRELTKELGEAIRQADKEKVKKALDNLEKTVKNDAEKKEQLEKELKEAIEEADQKNDQLNDALKEFAENLEEAKDDEALEQAFDQAEKEINEALDGQKQLSDEQKALDEIMQEAKKAMLDPNGQPSEQGQEGDKPGDQPGENGQPVPVPGEDGDPVPGGNGGDEADEDQPGPGGNGGDHEQAEKMTEQIYDPVGDNRVNYGKVFAAYYEDYLAAVREGRVTEEMQKVMDEYFSALSK